MATTVNSTLENKYARITKQHFHLIQKKKNKTEQKTEIKKFKSRKKKIQIKKMNFSMENRSSQPDQHYTKEKKKRGLVSLFIIIPLFSYLHIYLYTLHICRHVDYIYFPLFIFLLCCFFFLLF